MKVKMLTNMTGPNVDRPVGTIVELSDEEALRVCAAGFAEPVDDEGKQALEGYEPGAGEADEKDRITEPRSRRRRAEAAEIEGTAELVDTVSEVENVVEVPAGEATADGEPGTDAEDKPHRRGRHAKEAE